MAMWAIPPNQAYLHRPLQKKMRILSRLRHAPRRCCSASAREILASERKNLTKMLRRRPLWQRQNIYVKMKMVAARSERPQSSADLSILDADQGGMSTGTEATASVVEYRNCVTTQRCAKSGESGLTVAVGGGTTDAGGSDKL